MNIRQSRVQIKDAALAKLNDKIQHAVANGNVAEFVVYARGVVYGLELAQMFHGAAGAAEAAKLLRDINSLSNDATA